MKKKQNFREKPYNRCLYCEHQGKSCDGPRTSSMTLDRWKEFMRDMKAVSGKTNQEIAEETLLSVTTVEKALSPTYDKDIQRETCRLIENAIIGSSGQYPCLLAFAESVPDSAKELSSRTKELEDLKSTIDKIHESYKAELEIVRKEAQEKIDFLRMENEKKDKIITRLLEK